MRRVLKGKTIWVKYLKKHKLLLPMLRCRNFRSKKMIIINSFSATRPATDYTQRVIAKFPGVSIPLESNLILWQH
jgi:hypothetical protein